MSTKPKVTAADGVTEVFNIPGYPLMVRAVDFNAAMRPAAPTASEITAELIAALREMTEIAEKVDGWQSFPSEPIERAYAVLALAPVAGGVPAEPNRADFCIGKSCACDPGPCAELAMRPRAAPASPQSDAAQPASSSAPTVFFPCVDDKDNARLTERSAFYLAYPHGFEDRYYEDMLWECWCKALEASSSAPAVGGVAPCPFCGGTNISAAEGSTFRWWVASCNECGACAGEARRQTLGDGTNAEWDAKAKADALKEWNTRAAPAGAAGQDAPDIQFRLRMARMMAELHGEGALSEQQCARYMRIDLVSWRKLEHCFSAGAHFVEGEPSDLPTEDSETVLRAALAAQGDGGTTA